MLKAPFLTCLSLLLFCLAVSAQNREPVFVHEKYQHPTQLIAQNMLPDVYELSKLCINSVTFVRFVVGADGKVKQVACTQNTPPVIAKTLKRTVLTTSGHWLPKEVNGVAVESKPYLLPVMFDVNYGCPKDDASKNRYEDAIRRLLVFDDGNFSESMECTMLPPLVQRYVKN